MNSQVNVEHYTDSNWSKNGFSTMEEIRRMGKLCDITLVVSLSIRINIHALLIFMISIRQMIINLQLIE